MDIQEFIEWVKKGDRSVKITIERNRYNVNGHGICTGEGEVSVNTFVYDYQLCEGAYVDSAEQIELEKNKEMQERQELQKLLKKYGV